jgi:hypothetical protein
MYFPSKQTSEVLPTLLSLIKADKSNETLSAIRAELDEARRNLGLDSNVSTDPQKNSKDIKLALVFTQAEDILRLAERSLTRN